MGTSGTSSSAVLFRLIFRLILLAVLGNILLPAEFVMGNGLFERLLSAKSDRRMNCYKITEKVEEQFYTGLMDWIVVEDTEGHRFVVIGGSTKRAFEDSFNPDILSVEGVKTLEDAFAAVVSPDGCGIAREFLDRFGADTIDNSIDRVKILYGGRMFGETQPETAPTDVEKRGRMSARLESDLTPAEGASKEGKPHCDKIKNLFRKLRQKVRAQQAYWKELDPTPSGRACRLLLVQ